MKLFGTDGIRGKANQYPITAETALDLGKAFVTLIAKGNNSKKIKIAVGRDTRLSGAMLEEALIAGITSAGADAVPLGIIPTNGVSYLIGFHGCDGGVMISASHNPADENGFKFMSKDGFKFNEELEAQLEEIFFSKKFASSEPGSVFRLRDVKQDYISMVGDTLQGSDLSGLKVAIDTGNGSASYLIKDLFSELKAEATIINNEPDGLNINKDCGALFTQKLKKVVEENKLDAGVAFDGDADRIVMIDETGNIVEGDSLIAIAAIHLKENGKLNKDTIVVTNYSNCGLDNSMQKLGVKTVRTKTGDKFVSAELFNNSYSIGGETSGHVIFSEFSKTADAVIASVQILNSMKEQGKKLSELASFVEKYPQLLVNVAVNEKKELKDIPAVAEKIKEAESRLENGRVFVRYSGTENKMRILVEGENEKIIKELADSIVETVKSEIGVK